MARFRIISILVSGVVFAFMALVIVRAISAFEERAFEAGRALLVAGAEHAELELSSGGNALPDIARVFAADDEIISATRSLGQLMSRAPAGSAAANRIKPAISRLSKKLNERLTEMRSDEQPALEAEFDALTVTDADGTVLVTDSSNFRTGMRLLSGETAEDAETAPPTASKNPSGVRDGTHNLLRAAEKSPSMATLIGGAKSKRNVVWTGAASITSRSRTVGYVLCERRLKALPQPNGVSAILVVDDLVQMGQAPEGYQPGGETKGEPFLLAAKAASSAVPWIGEVPIAPLFVGERGVGVWANSFVISPDASSAVGYVLTDVTPLFADLGGFQVMTLLLAIVGWLVHVSMILLSGRGVTSGLNSVSDFLGRIHQGTATETRLNERKLPSSVHRLARLINKTLERTPGVVAPIAGAPSLDEVLKAQGEAGTTSELAFAAIDNAGNLGVAGEGRSGTNEDLAAVEDFDPFNATGNIATVKPSMEFVDEDGFSKIEPLSDDVVGGGVAPDPMADSASLPSEAEADTALAQLGDDDETLSKPGVTPPKPPDEPRAGSAVADLFSSRGGGIEEAEHQIDAEVLNESERVGPSVDLLEAHYRDVYDKFVAARESCGESTDELSFDKFSTKLDKSREAVMSKHDCSDVRFSVYVKNGKAALKATPGR